MTRPNEKKDTVTAQQPPSTQPQEQMELAYQVHTLAQMLYGHLSVSNPWAAYSNPWSVSPQMQAPVQWMQGVTPTAQAVGWMEGNVPTWPTAQSQAVGPFMNLGFGPFPR